MEIFIDSANLEEIKYWHKLGILKGVTTNPALLSAQKTSPVKLLKEISNLVAPYPVSAQVTKETSGDIIKQAKFLAGINKNIVVKLPALKKYLEIVPELKKENIKTNITLCFDPTTALLFSKVGADYVSMIIGRSEDFNIQQSNLIQRTRELIIGSPTKILAASFRNPGQLEIVISHKPDIVTVPHNTLLMSLDNPISNSGVNDFKDKWQTVQKNFKDEYETS